MYINIIAKARSENNTLYFYYKMHHIIPMACGGNDDPENLVFLTAKEHFICHLLLTKMCIGQSFHKMIHALNFIIRIKNRKITSRLVIIIIAVCKKLFGRNKEKLSLSLTGK